eukprot:TRINITY_DN773118_c0_g1_i1.p2 TRINITY_DN773118_c0_g1~~TRINITY_DN773118_c0_g1_i1.p2  ORF type:complete len:179 (+),score=14.29 TRINITY_DN773118_c0_g1_i1:23-538(+)
MSFEKKVFEEIKGITEESLVATLKKVEFVKAKEVAVVGGKAACVLITAFKSFKNLRKVQPLFIGELEKKLNQHVFVFPQRQVVAKNFTRNLKYKGFGGFRPRTRCLTTVHENILSDICYPSEIVGKRIRYKVDGSKVLKVYLKNDQESEVKVDSFSAVYKKLTNQDVVFEF